MEAKRSLAGLLLLAVTVAAVVGMVAMPVGAVSDDAYESNDHSGEAAQIEPGTYEDLHMAEDDWADFYAVELEEGENISAAIDFDHDQADLDLVLNGPNSWYEDYSFSNSDGESVETTAEESGTYHVVVYGFGQSGADYDLSVDASGAEPAGDRFENNDDVATAAEIDPGEHANLTVSADDPDVYAVEADAGDQIVAATQIYSSSGALSVQVSGPSQTAAASAGEEWRPSGLVASEDGTYHVTVTAESSSEIWYDLQVGVGSSDEFDANEQLDTAPTIESGTYSNLSLVEGPDVDSYQVQLEDGEELWASTSASTESAVEFFLTNEEGESVETAEKPPYGDDPQLSYLAPEDGTYTINAYVNGSAANYTLETEISEPEPATDPNETDGIVSSGSPDTYEIDSVDDGQLVSVATKLNDSSDDLTLRLLGSTEFHIDESGTKWRSIETVADGPESYEIEVSTTEETAVEYDLQTAIGEPDQFDPNSDLDAAAVITSGDYDDLSLVGNADQDFYAVELEEGDTLNANFDSTDMVNNSVIGFSESSDQFKVGSYDGDGLRSLSMTANSTGTYYLSIGTPAEQGIEYDLDVSIDDAPVSQEQSSVTTQLNETVSQNTSQSYTVDVEEGELLSVGTQFDSLTDAATMTVTSPSGETITENYESQWRLVELVANETGTYEVSMTSTSDTSLAYDIFIDTGTPDQYESNGAKEKAPTLAAGTYDGRSITGLGDVDFYGVDLESDETLTATVSSDDGASQTNTYALGNQSGYEPGTSTADGSTVTITAEDSGIHYVAVYGAVGSSFEYELDLDVTDS